MRHVCSHPKIDYGIPMGLSAKEPAAALRWVCMPLCIASPREVCRGFLAWTGSCGWAFLHSMPCPCWSRRDASRSDTTFFYLLSIYKLFLVATYNSDTGLMLFIYLLLSTWSIIIDYLKPNTYTCTIFVGVTLGIQSIFTWPVISVICDYRTHLICNQCSLTITSHF